MIINAAPVSAGGKDIQVYSGMDYKSTTSLSATAVTATAKATGTYKVSWMGFRSASQNTFSSRAYVNGSAVGTDQTTFTRTYGQYCEETLSLNAGDVVTIYARSRNTSSYMYVGNLILEQQ